MRNDARRAGLFHAYLRTVIRRPAGIARRLGNMLGWAALTLCAGCSDDVRRAVVQGDSPVEQAASTENSAGSGMRSAAQAAVGGSSVTDAPNVAGAAGVGPIGLQRSSGANRGDVVLPAAADRDADGIDDVRDNCPSKPNSEQADRDADLIGDACDNCVGLANADQHDANSDGVGDVCMCDSPIVKCENGQAGPYPCAAIDLLSRVTFNDLGGRSGNAVWGGVDSKSKREIGVAGLDNGTAFLDLSVPSCPVVLGHLPSTSSRSETRDVKVFGDYALIVAEIQNHGLQIFDMRTLPARGEVTGASNKLKVSALYMGTSDATVGNAHNIVVNEETKMVYLAATTSCGRALHMIDFSDALKPKFAGCVTLPDPVHDAQCLVYRGPDTTYVGHEICVTYNGGDNFSVVDVQNKSAPKVISTTHYPGGAYCHQGWFNAAHTHIAMSDEMDEGMNGHPTRTYILDMTDLDKPVALAPYEAKTMATDHNGYIVGNFLYQANYNAGLHVLDVSQMPAGKLKEVGFFDTMPNSDRSDMYGAWTAYPFFKSGIVLTQTMDSGLFIVMPQRHALTTQLSDEARQ